MADMKVSWKQSSAASRPTAATRKRHTSSRWPSRKRWKGGLLTRRRRAAGAVRETGSPDRPGDGAQRERGGDQRAEREGRRAEARLERLELGRQREQARRPLPPRDVGEQRRRRDEQDRLDRGEHRPEGPGIVCA